MRNNMNINRIKYLAGMTSEKATPKPTKISKTFEDIKLSEEVNFRILAKQMNMDYSIFESGKNSSAIITVEESTLEKSEYKMNQFILAWNEFKTPDKNINEDHGKGYYVLVDGKEDSWHAEKIAADSKAQKLKQQGKSKVKVVADVEDETEVKETVDVSSKDEHVTLQEKIKDEFDPINSDENEKIYIPKEVISQTKLRIAEIKKSIEDYKQKGTTNHGEKENIIESLEKILNNLSSGNSKGFKDAQILFLSLMSPITDLFPPVLINFLANKK